MIEPKRFVVGITGATGAIYGIRLLEALQGRDDVEVHLVVSRWAEETIRTETDYRLEAVRALAGQCYEAGDLGAALSSGSFRTMGMVILPCSMKTVSAIAHGYDDNLLTRAAGVTLKEGRPLLLCPRETPLSAIHLENLLKLSRLGVRIVPPMPGFYSRPQTIEDLVRCHTVRVLDQMGLPAQGLDTGLRWQDRDLQHR